MFNPLIKSVTEMTSLEFEKYTEDIIQILCADVNIDFEIKRDVKLDTHDGTYQIDVYIEYELIGVKNIILVECKKHSRSVERKDVAILNDKLNSLGAHKGVMFSTSNFQSGALKYAEIHGIALVQIIDGKLLYEAKSMVSSDIAIPDFVDLPRFCGEHLRLSGENLHVTVFQKEYKKSLQDVLFTE